MAESLEHFVMFDQLEEFRFPSKPSSNLFSIIRRKLSNVTLFTTNKWCNRCEYDI
jgi:hypothetical protein